MTHFRSQIISTLFISLSLSGCFSGGNGGGLAGDSTVMAHQVETQAQTQLTPTQSSKLV